MGWRKVSGGGGGYWCSLKIILRLEWSILVKYGGRHHLRLHYHFTYSVLQCILSESNYFLFHFSLNINKISTQHYLGRWIN